MLATELIMMPLGSFSQYAASSLSSHISQRPGLFFRWTISQLLKDPCSTKDAQFHCFLSEAEVRNVLWSQNVTGMLVILKEPNSKYGGEPSPCKNGPKNNMNKGETVGTTWRCSPSTFSAHLLAPNSYDIIAFCATSIAQCPKSTSAECPKSDHSPMVVWFAHTRSWPLSQGVQW